MAPAIGLALSFQNGTDKDSMAQESWDHRSGSASAEGVVAEGRGATAAKGRAAIARVGAPVATARDAIRAGDWTKWIY